MKKDKNLNFFEKNLKKTIEINYSSFINSFKKISFNIVYMVFNDLLFYGISTLILYLGFKNLERIALKVNFPTNLLGLGVQQADALLRTVRGFYITLIATLIIIFLLLILNWSVFKGLNWNIALNKKFNFGFFKRFLLLNIAWLGSIILLVFLVAAGFKQNAVPIFLLIILLLSVYLTNILYALFPKESSFKAVKEAFKLAFTKIHYFILPYAILLLILYIASLLLSKITLPQTPYMAISLLLFTIFIAWSRLYIVEVVDSAKTK